MRRLILCLALAVCLAGCESEAERRARKQREFYGFLVSVVFIASVVALVIWADPHKGEGGGSRALERRPRPQLPSTPLARLVYEKRREEEETISLLGDDDELIPLARTRFRTQLRTLISPDGEAQVLRVDAERVTRRISDRTSLGE